MELDTLPAMRPVEKVDVPRRRPGIRRLSALFSQLRRDLAMVGESLTGSARVLIDRPPKPSPPSSLGPSTRTPPRHSFEVVLLRRETTDAVTIGFGGTDLETPPLPGQFITLELVVDGQRHRRSYSLTSLPQDPALAITVKRLDAGRVSTHLTGAIRIGDRVDISGPSGSFTLAPSRGAERRVLLVAGGSGITPVWTILRCALAAEPGTRLHLIYGNRSWSDVIFGPALNALGKDEPRLTVDHVLEDPPAGWKGGLGALDSETLERRLERTPFALEGAEAFLCGPEPMRRGARETLRRHGLADIHEEVYVRPRRAPRSRQPVHVRHPEGGRALVVEGRESILEAAERQDVALPYSCSMGGCGACRVRLIRGTVEMDEPNCLTVEEREAGFVLTCVGRPTAPCTIETPDSRDPS